jgi:hypothetical protein
MPHCHWLLEAKPCWLCCTTLLRWTDNFTYTASIYEHGQTWTDMDRHGQKGMVQAIPRNAHLMEVYRPRTVPLLKPRHMFCTLGMPTSVAW